MHLQFIKTLVSLQRTASIRKIDDLQVYNVFFWTMVLRGKDYSHFYRKSIIM